VNGYNRWSYNKSYFSYFLWPNYSSVWHFIKTCHIFNSFCQTLLLSVHIMD
jgi:hypothetical protein